MTALAKLVWQLALGRLPGYRRYGVFFESFFSGFAGGGMAGQTRSRRSGPVRVMTCG